MAVGPGDGPRAATTTSNERGLEAGTTPGHENSYIARKIAELRRERELGVGQC